MEKPFCTYKIKKSETDSFFIGANSEIGFTPSFDFSSHEKDFDRLIILKGGPGTGKSTLMKKTAKKYGEDTVLYYCSSDTDSLDGAVFRHNGTVCAICDGTAPHVAEMSYPGAVSEIVNLGEYWDAGKIAERRDEIIELSGKKSMCFSAAYTYLHSAADVNRSIKVISEKVCDAEKAFGAANRLISKYKIKKGNRKSVYTESFSMNGCIAFDTYFKKADEIYYLNDAYGVGRIFLNYIDNILSEGKYEYTAVISPVDTSLLSGIYIDSAGVLISHNNFTELPAYGKNINIKRFLNASAPEYKNRYSFGVRCYNALLAGAGEHLGRARGFHFELEKIYIAAMNFKRIDRLPGKLFSEPSK